MQARSGQDMEDIVNTKETIAFSLAGAAVKLF